MQFVWYKTNYEEISHMLVKMPRNILQFSKTILKIMRLRIEIWFALYMRVSTGHRACVRQHVRRCDAIMIMEKSGIFKELFRFLVMLGRVVFRVVFG